MRRRIVSFIRGYHQHHGVSPTYREIAAGVGLSSTSSVVHHIRKLEEDDRIQRQEGHPRTLRIL